METRQWSHVIRVTAIVAAQYGQLFETFATGSNGNTSFPQYSIPIYFNKVNNFLHLFQ